MTQKIEIKPEVSECIERIKETWKIDTLDEYFNPDMEKAATLFCNIAYKKEIVDKDRTKVKMEKQFHKIAGSQTQKAKEAFGADKEMALINEALYNSIKDDVEALKAGDTLETYYCADAPYYKGWETVLDITEKCVKEGGSYSVSNS